MTVFGILSELHSTDAETVPDFNREFTVSESDPK
jgi:hypothetical protein